MHKGGFIYILTNYTRTTLYIGVTNDITRRLYEHKNHIYHNSFTDKYKVDICIYYEDYKNIEDAILREKEIKKWNRQKKENLINSINPEWKEIDVGAVNISH